MTVIEEALAGRRILLTGATGFLGSALLERLLGIPTVERIDVVARGDAEARLRWLLAGSLFGPLRTKLGSGFDEEVSNRVRAVSCDLASEEPPVADDIDLVIHAAATVSFDPPIHEAFATNLRGSIALFKAASGRSFIHTSTAYVAGITRGVQLEEPLDRDVDWRAEADAADSALAQTEAHSRAPEVLGKLQSRARAEMGKAGPQSVARRAEELRREWVTERLVDAGRTRARSLGWPDVYTFTKALTEMALREMAGDAHPLAIVRPSIIESALVHPFPGWIEGFRMADPVMLGYGRGALPDFPGIPEGVLDVIPVDMVCNCIIAVAAGLPGTTGIYHCCSGARNPLRFREVYEQTRAFFLANPLPERGRGTYKVPEWSFPGRRAVDKKIKTAERLLGTAERVVGRMPRNRFARETARRVDRFRRQFDFVKRYADLYGPYVEAEVIYTDDRARALHESLSEGDRTEYGFDPTTFTWTHYLQEVHLPMLTAPLRWPAPRPPDPVVKISFNGDQGSGTSAPVIAAFDIEGTVVDSNVVESYTWLRLSEIEDPSERARVLATIARGVPGFLKAERRDRGEFLRAFYKSYEGVPADRVRRLADSAMAELMLRKISPQAVRRIREHKRAGHRVIFVTGSLDFIMRPLEHLADEVVAARLREVDGLITGELEMPPLVGEARASWLRQRADEMGADLQHCYAYADSMSDLPLLECVGHAVAVNPDVALARLARTRKWPIEEWEPEKGMPRISLPEAKVVTPR